MKHKIRWMKNRLRPLRAVSVLCLVGLLFAVSSAKRAFAQMDQGAIVGVVVDPSGAAIPGARVTLTDTLTGLVLTTKTNESGNYFFAPIKTGNYTVSASAPNFETTEQQNIIVHVTDRLNIPLSLKPGNVSTTVTVTSAAPIMQTQTAETAVDVDSKFLNDAPLANRNWVFMAQETPGVSPYAGRGGGNGDFSSNGQHAEQNNYMLDGVDDNVSNSDYIQGAEFNVAPPPDAISEFKVENSNYSAEIGRGHAAVINATTKSGTNEIHGDVWEYNRNTIFDGRVWNTGRTATIPVFHLNQFGATLGAPIIKNHLFFFGDIQDSRYVNGANPTTMTVPTPRERRGDFTELLNPVWGNGSCPAALYVPNTNTGTYKCSSNNTSGTGTAPTGTLQQSGSQQYTYDGITFAPGQNVFVNSPAQIDQTAQKILQAFPCPNYAAAGQPNFNKPNGGWSTGDCNSASDTDSGPTGSNYQAILKTASDTINWDGKLDWNLSSRDLATFRVDLQHTVNTNPAPLGPILDGTQGYGGHTQTWLSENYMISETHTFSSTLINEFRFGFNYGTYANLQYNYNRNIAASLGLNGVPFNGALQLGGLPLIQSNYQHMGTWQNDPAHEGENIYQVMDNVTKIVGNHSLKMGFEAMPMRWYSTWAAQPLGEYNYSGQFTQVSGLGGPSGNAGADFLALGTLPGGGYTTTNNMASGQLSTFQYQHFVMQYFGAYLQDDWKVNSKLTLNLGLRYEYFTPKREQANQLGNFVFLNAQVTPNGTVGSSELVYPRQLQNQVFDPNFLAIMNADHIVPVYTSNPYLSAYPKINLSPRLGAAYSIDNKTVVRAAGGVFFGGFEPGGGAANLINPPQEMLAGLPSLPTCTQGNYCGSQYQFNNTLENGLGTFQGVGGIQHNATFPEIGMEDPVMHMPYTVQYNASVQRAFWKDTTATVSYVGSIGHHLVTGINNPAMPQAITIGGQDLHGLTPAPHFNGYFWMSWTGASNYNSMQIVVQKHYSNGLSLLGTYTWAHAFDDTTDLLGGDNTYKQAALIPPIKEFTQSGYDLRHRAVINVDYDLPVGVGRQFLNHPGILDEIVGGWKTDMQWWIQGGLPFTVGIARISGYQNANGGLANSAVKIGDPRSSKLTAPDQSNPLTASGQIAANAPSNTAANSCAAQTKTRSRWFNPCAFADPLGVVNTSNAAAVAALAPYATGYFSYYSPATGADNALADGKYSTSGGTSALGVDAPYVTGYAAARPFFGSVRNDASGPGNWRLNASLFKDFKTIREQYIEFRADAFNLLNHPSFGNPGNTSTNLGTNSVSLTGPFNNPNNTIDARFFQLSGKYVF
jgi:Carboxypeptidase regulatory-like domain/TonB-dependent Receptor Plug Domain